MAPVELMRYLDTVSPRLKAIVDYITKDGQATRAKIQDAVGIKKPQVANVDLVFLCRLGILERTFGQRKTATHPGGLYQSVSETPHVETIG